MPPPTADSSDSPPMAEVSAPESMDGMDGAEALASIMEALPGWVNDDAALVRRGRFVAVDCLIDAGGAPFYLSIREGRITRMERGPALMRPWRFCIGVSAEGLRRFWAAVPDPGWHDLFALAKRGEAVLEGDLRPLMANLRYFKELLATPRGHLNGPGGEG